MICLALLISIALICVAARAKLFLSLEHVCDL